MSKAEEPLSSSPLLHLPPGFRFHPTDEELVVHYLAKKAESQPFPVAVIAEVDLYKFNPWDLPEKAHFGEREWYFFTPRDRKYPKGARPNRAASSGYWKATGTDKSIFTGGHKRVGVKKALVYYDGKAPKGVKSNWIMHEYRLADTSSNKSPKKSTSLRLDDSVLCRIYEKTSSAFKVMVPVPAARRLEPEPETEVEFEQGPEAEECHQKQEPGLDEMLASLPDLDISRSQLGTHRTPTNESLEEFLNINQGELFQAMDPVEYAEDSAQVNLNSFATQVDNKLELSNYWLLCSLGRTPSNISDLLQGGRKRKKSDAGEHGTGSFGY